MSKKILFTLILSIIYYLPNQAQELDPKMQQFIKRIDGASLNDLEKELNEGIKGVKMFMNFIGNSSHDTLQVFTPDTERLTTPFKIDTSAILMAENQFQKIGFTQSFINDKTKIKFHKKGNKYWNKISLPEGIHEKLIAKKIYYKDGTTIHTINQNKISFFWEEDWGAIKVIDSIDVDYNLQYIKTYDSLTITKKTKKLNYKEGAIKVKKLEKNYLYITVSDAYAQNLYVRALNKDGKPINENSSSFSPTTNTEAGGEINKVLKTLEDVQYKLQAKKFKDTESLKAYLLKKMAKIKTKKDKDGVAHLKYYFEGNIKKVQLYIPTTTNKKTIPFTAINNSTFKNILIKENKDQIIFMDENANELFAIPGRAIERIGNQFVIENGIYYYLNLKTKTLDKITAIKIFETINNLIFIQKNRETDFIAYDHNLNPLSDIEFTNVWSVDQDYAHTLDPAKNNYALDASGRVKKIEGIDYIGEMSDGLLIARLKDKFGFINPAGEIIIPIIYSDVKLFNEGLAVVKNQEGKFGYINTKNEMVLALNYDIANSFENGIALVHRNNKYYLINKKGEIIVTSNSNSYFMNGSGIQKTYQFDDKKYNAFGQLIPKTDNN